MTQYLSEFEELANRTIGLPPPFLLSCFVSGLTPEIRREVQALQPLTLVQAAVLARLQEEKLLDNRPPPRPRPVPPVPIPALVPPSPPPHSPRPTPLPPLLPTPTRTAPPPIRRLSPDEIASRRERGLCFYCDEKFHRGHKCASRIFLLIANEEDNPTPHIGSPNPPPDPPDHIDITNPGPAQISLNSLAGHLASETLQLMGQLFGHPVVVLVDGGSTHNFIQQELVTQLRLPCQPTPSPLRVMVGNG